MSNSIVREAFESSVTARPVSLKREPGVDRPEAHAARAARSRRPVDVLEQPLDLRGGEVGVDHEPGALAHERLEALRAQLVAARGGAAVLPDDRVVQRRPAALVPRDDRLALVRDADRRERARRDAGGHQRLVGDDARHVPDLRGIVLDPAGLREVLRELAVGAAARCGLRRRTAGTSCRSCPGRSRGSSAENLCDSAGAISTRRRRSAFATSSTRDIGDITDAVHGDLLPPPPGGDIARDSRARQTVTAP